MMKKRMILMLTLLCAIAQGAWAQSPTTVSTEKQLTDAIADGAENIQLVGEIQLSKYLDIDGKTVTIDLNGHKLSRNLDTHGSTGHVIWAHGGSNLTLTNTAEGGGIVEGGKANNGGAIHIPHGNTVTATNVTFQNNSAADHAGAIWNNGTFTATNCTFESNTANDVGAIYNAVTSDGAGTAILTGCTFTGNKGTTGAGALANAVGATVMTIIDCTIQNNTASSNGGGIWNGGTLNMQGAVKVTGNKRTSGSVSNVFLKTGMVITVTGDLTGSTIGIDLENISGTFTSGWGGKDPSGIFTADLSDEMNVDLEGNEACVITKNPVYYVERSWDATNKQVVSTEKRMMGFKIDGEDIPREGEYKEVTNAPGDSPNEWFRMGGYGNSAEYYVVRGNVNRETIVVLGKNVHLILCDNATLTLTGGLKLEDDHKLYIHCESYGENMGRLMVTNKYEKAAGIGSAQLVGKEKTVGELIIHGGHVEVTGGDLGAGIGSCARIKGQEGELCNSVTVYGGYVKATGGKNGAGIGGGAGYYEYGIDGGKFVLYDGTVIAQGGMYAAGLGGGGSWCKFIDQDGHGGYGDEVIVYGGELMATGGKYGAGIGSGNITRSANKSVSQCGGTLRIHGGMVTAIGGVEAAGIGGGSRCGGANVYVYDGTVMAIGGNSGAAIGGGCGGKGFVFHISGGMVTAKGGEKAAGIGGGDSGGGGDVTINNGTVIAMAGNQGGLENRAIGPGYNSSKYGTLTIGNEMMVGAGNNGSVERIYGADERVNACWYRSYAEISPCSHPSGITFTINGVDTHNTHCKHCTMPEKAAHFNSDGNGTCICGYKDGEGYHNITIATSSNGTNYEGVGVIANVGNDKPYTLPECSSIPDCYDFAGWVVNPTSHDNGILPIEGETLLQAGENIIVTGNISIFARYQALEISLADDGDNYETIYNYDGKLASTVTLTGRTFYKDGNWNTLCLPFAVPDGDEADGVTFSGTPFEGATVLTLDNATFKNSTLTLNFQETTTMEPGKPYLIKWAEDSEHPTIVNPVFNNVVISNTSPDDKAVVAGIVSFTGHYAPLNIGEEGDPTTLYLGTNNTFCYPDGAMCINSFRACFQANTSLGDVNGDGTINVTDVTLLVDYILGKEVENFIFENADITRDEIISVTDVTGLTDIILGGNNILKVVVNGAEGLSFSSGGSGPARISKDLK